MVRRDRDRMAPRARSHLRSHPSAASDPSSQGGSLESSSLAASPAPRWIVGPERDHETLATLVRAFTGASWEQAREQVRRGKWSVDGAIATDPSLRLRTGQALVQHERARRADRASSELEPSRLVYVDEHLVVVDKPAGVSTVPFEEGERGTLVDRVQRALYRRGRAPSNAPLFIVHRIDKDTSGLLVFGRTWLAKRHLASLFRAHTIERRYVALVNGHPSFNERTIETMLVEDRGDGIRGSARNPAPGVGKRAVTQIQVLARLDGPVTLVRCSLETGRTHQIRIHLAELGHPLVGERVYGREVARRVEHPRALLHALELGFTHPAQPARRLRFRRAPPEDFIVALREAGASIDILEIA
jgi:23S rRNA pseudouridine1911/1915/1917 synthase